MKTVKNILIAALIAISFGMINSKANAQVNVDVSFNLFYESLQPHGIWFNYSDFGMCWRPNGVSVSWQPYRDGRWMWTDYGWTWTSNYSWGWAPFHYGRWTYDEYYGWIWIPDYEWSPAWVEWRYSSDYVGWAPLPPRARFNVSIGVDIDDYGVNYHHWNYIYARDMANFRYRFIPRHRIYKIHRHTTNITNITIVNNHIYNYGPRMNDIERASGSKIRQYNIVQDREMDRNKSYHRVDNNSLHIYKPEISRSAGSTRSGTTNEINRTNQSNDNRNTNRTDRNSDGIRSGSTRSGTPNEINRTNQPNDNRNIDRTDRNADRTKSGSTRSEGKTESNVNKGDRNKSQDRSGVTPESRSNTDRNSRISTQKEAEKKIQNRTQESNKSGNTEKSNSRERNTESRERNKNR